MARHSRTVRAYKRDPRVVAITRLRANYRCEVRSCDSHQFVGSNSKHNIETHHLRILANGDEDVPESAVAVCAIHHRELHYGRSRNMLTTKPSEIRARDSLGAGSSDHG